MKKMLLVSMLQHSADLVKKVEPDLAGKVVTYIPTAGIAEEPVHVVIRELIPFYIGLIILLFILTYCPVLVTALPSLV